MITTVALFMVFTVLVNARIKTNGIWTGYDYSDGDYAIVNGMFQPISAEYTRRLNSARFFRAIPDYLTRENVVRIQRLFTESDFQFLFPNIVNSQVNYDRLIRAFARAPSFCGESMSNSDFPNLADEDKACKRELATFLAHVIYATGPRAMDPDLLTKGISFVEDLYCRDNPYPDATFDPLVDEYNFCWEPFDQDHVEDFPPANGKAYYGRGALFLTHSYRYGAFSSVWHPNQYDGFEVFLDEPEKVANDVAAFLSSAIWQYMVPNIPNPSLHEIASGIFPTDPDHDNGFGSTVVALNGTYECGYDFFNSGGGGFGIGRRLEAYDNVATDDRGIIYKYLLNYFMLDDEPDDSVVCADSDDVFPINQWGDHEMYWDYSTFQNECELTYVHTRYQIYNDDDYKRCVCHHWGNGAQDCAQVCTWTSSWEPTNTNIDLQIEVDDQLTDFWSISQIASGYLQQMVANAIPECKETETGDIIAFDIIVITLVEDNTGLSLGDPDFEAKYGIIDEDFNIGSDAAGHHLAYPLGQQSIITQFGVMDENLIYLEDTVDLCPLLGGWTFKVIFCLDEQELGYPRAHCEETNAERLLNLNITQSQDMIDADVCPIAVITPVTPVTPVNNQTTEFEDTEFENTPPVFSEWRSGTDDFIEVELDTELAFDFPPVYDADTDGDEIEITLDNASDDALYDFAEFDGQTLVLVPDSESQVGYYRASVILSDGLGETEYPVAVYVIAPEDYDFSGEEVDEDEDENDFLFDFDFDDSEDESESNLLYEFDLVTEDDLEELLELTDLTEEELDELVEEGELSEEELESLEELTELSEEELEVLIDDINLDKFDKDLYDSEEEYIQAEEQRVQEEIREEQKVVVEQVKFDFLEWKKDYFEKKVIEKAIEVQETGADPEEPVFTDKQPACDVKKFNEIGEMELIFNQKMLSPDFLTKNTLKSDVKYDKAGRRLQTDSSDGEINLDFLIQAEILPGGDDSSPIEALNFQIVWNNIQDDRASLDFKFDNPLDISVGETPDKVRIRFVDTSLFVGDESAKELPLNDELIKDIPKQFPDKDSYEVQEQMGQTVFIATGISVITQVCLTALMALTLKLMWLLLHTMQIIAFLRLAGCWPANVLKLMKFTNSAITYDIILKWAKEIAIGAYESTKSNVQDELDRIGIDDPDNFFLSLGIFSVVLILLIAALIFYIILERSGTKIKTLTSIKDKLKIKLFYQSWLQYFVEANLKMTHQALFYLYYATMVPALFTTGKTIQNVLFMIIIMFWPVFIMVWLTRNSSKLEQLEFKKKYGQMYLYNKTKEWHQYLYFMFFALRRFALVLSFIALKEQLLLLIFMNLWLSTLMAGYLIISWPHAEPLYNRLETFNELLIILLVYSMFAYIETSLLTRSTQWVVGLWSCALIISILAINFGAIILMACNKIQLQLKKLQNKRRSRQVGFVRQSSIRELGSMLQEEFQAANTLRRMLTTQPSSFKSGGPLDLERYGDTPPDQSSSRSDMPMLQNVQPDKKGITRSATMQPKSVKNGPHGGMSTALMIVEEESQEENTHTMRGNPGENNSMDIQVPKPPSQFKDNSAKKLIGRESSLPPIMSPQTNHSWSEEEFTPQKEQEEKKEQPCKSTSKSSKMLKSQATFLLEEAEKIMPETPEENRNQSPPSKKSLLLKGQASFILDEAAAMDTSEERRQDRRKAWAVQDVDSLELSSAQFNKIAMLDLNDLNSLEDDRTKTIGSVQNTNRALILEHDNEDHELIGFGGGKRQPHTREPTLESVGNESEANRQMTQANSLRSLRRLSQGGDLQNGALYEVTTVTIASHEDGSLANLDRNKKF